MEQDTITFQIKVTFQEKNFSLTLPANQTVQDLKEACANEMQVTVEQVRLVHIGKNLTNDYQTLEAFAQKPQIYMVITQQRNENQSVPQNISTGTGEMTGLVSGLNHFGVMSQAQSMMNDIPDLSDMDDQPIPPQLQWMLQDPTMRQNMKEMMRTMLQNPQTRNAMMSSNPAMQNLVRKMPHAMEALSDPRVLDQALSMIDRIGNSTQQSGSMGGLPGSFPAPGSAQQVIVPVQTQQEKFKEQLEWMRQMGFEDEEQNIEALEQTQGNVYEAIELVEAMNEEEL